VDQITRRLGRGAATSLLCLSLASPAALAQSGQSAAPADSSDAVAEELRGRLETLTEQVQTLGADADKLKKFKFSGYVQVRWEASEDGADTVKVSGSPASLTTYNRERFSIRRARIKLNYVHSPLTEAVVYINAGTDRAVQLLEAYGTVRDPWTPDHRHALTFGQFNVPFGYEIERSSASREVPERSRAENVLFPGERDRGLKLVSNWMPKLETVVGVLNGRTTGSSTLPGDDPTRGKDFVGRARFVGGVVDAAGSIYLGKDVVPLTGPDVEYDKTRYGFDTQGYWELPRAGGGSLRGEFYSGQNANSDSISALVQAPTSANPATLLKPGADPGHLATDFRGWYLMAVQNFGERLQAAARYDLWDPNVDVDHDQYERVNLALHAFYDGQTRVTVSYEWITTEKLVSGQYVDPQDDLWTVQFQYKF
jgi:hypothetical protein